MSIFEQATRQQLRFPSAKGSLTVEDLWQLPLQAKSGFDLDTVAKNVNSSLKAIGEESFVTTSTNPSAAPLALALDIVKYIISVKKTENEATRARADRLTERNKLVNILAEKQDSALRNLTPEEIQKRLAELEA